MSGKYYSKPNNWKIPGELGTNRPRVVNGHLFYGASSQEEYAQWILDHEKKLDRLDMWDKIITVAGTVLAIGFFVLALVLYQ